MSPPEEKIDKCCVCLGHYDDGDHRPKSLLCSHTACLRCVSVKKSLLLLLSWNLLFKSQELVKKSRIVVRCHTCRRYTPCPGGVDDLMNNTTALAETDLFRSRFVTFKNRWPGGHFSRSRPTWRNGSLYHRTVSMFELASQKRPKTNRSVLDLLRLRGTMAKPVCLWDVFNTRYPIDIHRSSLGYMISQGYSVNISSSLPI
jgi:hypothetical protein